MPCRSGSPHAVLGAGPGFVAVSFFGAGSAAAGDWPATNVGANLTRPIMATRTPSDVSNRRLMDPSLTASVVRHAASHEKSCRGIAAHNGPGAMVPTPWTRAAHAG